ncbi:MAG: transcriptional regulator [Thermoguttaceae bacterium]
MTQQRNEQEGKQQEVPSELVDLVDAIQHLPATARDQVEAALERVVDSTRRRRRILSLVQDALSQLRLDMKYLMFDLEATRRERDDYRRQLEEAS